MTFTTTTSTMGHKTVLVGLTVLLLWYILICAYKSNMHYFVSVK